MPAPGPPGGDRRAPGSRYGRVRVSFTPRGCRFGDGARSAGPCGVRMGITLARAAPNPPSLALMPPSGVVVVLRTTAKLAQRKGGTANCSAFPQEPPREIGRRGGVPGKSKEVQG